MVTMLWMIFICSGDLCHPFDVGANSTGTYATKSECEAILNSPFLKGYPKRPGEARNGVYVTCMGKPVGVWSE